MKAMIPGIVLLVIGALNLCREIRKRQNCNTAASAVIVSVKHERHVGAGTSYTPVVEFSAGGKKVRGDGGGLGAKRSSKYKVGDTLEVLYNADHPEEFRIRGRNSLLIMSAFFLVFGIGAVLAAFLEQ